MSGIKSTETKPSAVKTVRPHVGREEPPVRWPSVATNGGAAYVSHPEPNNEDACPETGTEG